MFIDMLGVLPFVDYDANSDSELINIAFEFDDEAYMRAKFDPTDCDSVEDPVEEESVEEDTDVYEEQPVSSAKHKVCECDDCKYPIIEYIAKPLPKSVVKPQPEMLYETTNIVVLFYIGMTPHVLFVKLPDIRNLDGVTDPSIDTYGIYMFATHDVDYRICINNLYNGTNGMLNENNVKIISRYEPRRGAQTIYCGIPNDVGCKVVNIFKRKFVAVSLSRFNLDYPPETEYSFGYYIMTSNTGRPVIVHRTSWTYVCYTNEGALEPNFSVSVFNPRSG